MRTRILAVLAVGLLGAVTGGVLYSSDAYGRPQVTCSGTPGTLSGTTVNANVVVPSGSWCDIQGQTVNGNIAVSSGGGLVIGGGSTINGNVASGGAGSFPGNPCATPGVTTFSVVFGSGNQFNGNVTASGSASTVVVGGGGCGSETIKFQLYVQTNHAAVFVQGNSVGGNGYITNNTPGKTTITDNTVTGNLYCSGNGGVTKSGNTAHHIYGTDCA